GRPSRSATGGLPAIVNTNPSTINAPVAARIQRSIVHHQFARAERSARDTIMSSLASLLRGQQSLDKVAKTIAAFFEIGELIERRAGRRKKHDRLLEIPRKSIARGRRNSGFERTTALIRKRIPDGPREKLARLADQIGLDHFAEQRPQRFDAAFLRPAADDPKHFVEGQERLF